MLRSNVFPTPPLSTVFWIIFFRVLNHSAPPYATAKHPLVIRDPQTNKQLLFLGRRPHAYILGMEINQSEDLLDDIWQHATQEKFTWTQQWDAGDLLMWKNLNVLHKRDAFDPSTRRVMHRTQLKGDVKIAS